jgi:hypothetical protein
MNHIINSGGKILSYMGRIMSQHTIPAPVEESEEDFIMEINIASSGNFTLNAGNIGTYDATIIWGDNTTPSQIESFNDAGLTHSYASPGTYQIKISGSFPHLNTSPSGSHLRAALTKIVQWGNIGWKSMNSSFISCINLIELPDSPITGVNDVIQMSSTFRNCNGLVSLPENFFSNCVNATHFTGTFYSASGLTTIPSSLFAGANNILSIDSCFNGCGSLTAIPAGLFDDLTSCSGFSGTFNGCTSLTSLPEHLFANTINATSFSFTFFNIAATSIPATLFSGCVNATSFQNTFYQAKLESVPLTLFDNCPNVQDFGSCFRDCVDITSSVPELWNRTITIFYGDPDNQEEVDDPWMYDEMDVMGYNCFLNCVNIENYADIPADWK